MFGGYKPIDWNNQYNNQTRYCKVGFIFSLKNGNIQNSIFNHIKEPEKAIYCGSIIGPIFGIVLQSVHDKSLAFIAEEYLILQIIKKF
ncbi:hypothetical protein C2G38_2209829 [Gigaspora rosea]|uniref:Uncharacterized protein n=1 Tax=Gigaspora rosea TaxID=44941 RepID=A0A397UJX7_9GLOM|nr:hypothetical protein C2G38_2209829 [Gigaspora rosea]